MAGCITEDYRDMLQNAIAADMAKEILGGILRSIPICESAKGAARGLSGLAAAVEDAKKRSFQPGWGIAKYIDEKGAEHEYGSPSAAFEDLFHVSPSTQIECEVVAGETKCSPKTMVMSFQSRGMIIRGNGDPPPVITHAMSERDRVTLHQNWNSALKASGKHFTIYHPKSPQAREMDKEK